MRNLILLILIALTPKMVSQNLVANPSFEDNTGCPSTTGELAIGWNVTPNSEPSSPDYFHTCGPQATVGIPINVCGSQMAYDGNAYSGIYCYYNSFPTREYLQTHLNSPLIMGQSYNVSFYASLADRYGVAIGSLGAYISTDQIGADGTPNVINVVPQVISSSIISNNTGWTQISGNFIANGGEEYITIGNFSTDELTPRTTTGGPIWYMSYYYIDMVEVTANPLHTNEFQDSDANIYPNPFKDTIAIEYENKSIDDSIQVYSVNGQLLKKLYGEINTVNLSDLPKGVYFVSICKQNSNKLVKKIVKT